MNGGVPASFTRSWWTFTKPRYSGASNMSTGRLCVVARPLPRSIASTTSDSPSRSWSSVVEVLALVILAASSATASSAVVDRVVEQ